MNDTKFGTKDTFFIIKTYLFSIIMNVQDCFIFLLQQSNLIKSMRAFIPISLCWSSIFMLEIGLVIFIRFEKKTKRIRRIFFYSFTFSNSVVPFYANGWRIATPWLMFAVFQISFKLRIWKAIASNGKQSLALYLLPAPQFRSHFISSLSILCTHNGECGGNLCPHHIYHVSLSFVVLTSDFPIFSFHRCICIRFIYARVFATFSFFTVCSRPCIVCRFSF